MPATQPPQQDDGELKSAALELLWTHRHPSDADRADNPKAAGGDSVSDVNGGGRATVVAGRAGDASPQATGRAPSSGGGGVAEGEGTSRPDGSPDIGGGEGGATPEQAPRDRTVTALCFHQLNKDVLAVGYGAFFYSPSVNKRGAILFWSVSARTREEGGKGRRLRFTRVSPTLPGARCLP